MTKESIENLKIGHDQCAGSHFIVELNAGHDSAAVEIHTTHRHDFHALYVILEGSGQFVIDFVDYPIARGQLFYVRPEQVMMFLPSKEVRYSAVQFSDEFFLSATLPDRTQWKNLQNVYDLTPTEMQSICHWIDHIKSESENFGSDRNLILQMEVYCLMTTLERLSEAKIPADSTPLTIQKFRKLIDLHFRQWHQVSDYAAELGVTPNYLNILTVKHLGQTALELIHSRLSLETKRMLLIHEHDVGQIANELGFNEVSYFTRFFKRINGMTPTQFRSRMNGVYRKK